MLGRWGGRKNNAAMAEMMLLLVGLVMVERRSSQYRRGTRPTQTEDMRHLAPSLRPLLGASATANWVQRTDTMHGAAPRRRHAVIVVRSGRQVLCLVSTYVRNSSDRPARLTGAVASVASVASVRSAFPAPSQDDDTLLLLGGDRGGCGPAATSTYIISRLSVPFNNQRRRQQKRRRKQRRRR